METWATTMLWLFMIGMVFKGLALCVPSELRKPPPQWALAADMLWYAALIAWGVGVGIRPW